VTHTSNVGIGTVKIRATNDSTVYDGTARLEHATSNAILEFKTTGGVSNIYATPSGNVHVNPSSGDMLINSNLEVTGDLNIDGKIDLGNQVAIGLGGSEASTALHVGGGFISGSNDVACKRYSKTFELGTTKAKMIRLFFGDASFYAKIVAMIRKVDGSAVRDMSTMVLEVQGGTHDGSYSSTLNEEITVGAKNLFGGDTDYPWNPNISVGKRGIIMTPVNTENTRVYSYDIHVELYTSRGGRLISIKNNVAGWPSNNNNLDVNNGETVAEFTY
jgi:hypothetical protein